MNIKERIELIEREMRFLFGLPDKYLNIKAIECYKKYEAEWMELTKFVPED